MSRALIDRWTDTTAFRVLLFLSAVAVLPVLAVGLGLTVIGGAMLVWRPSTIEAGQLLFGAVVLGGVLGFVGYASAHRIAKNGAGRAVTPTLLLLTIGVITALAVTGVVVFQLVSSWRAWGVDDSLGVGALFAVANLVWAMSGVAWMQRLARGYAERAGRAFDGLPVAFLCLSVALATAAVLGTGAP